MIPIADSVRARSFPYVNVAFILINVALFLYEVALSQQVIAGNLTELDRFIRHWGNIPACTFDAMGWDVALTAEGAARCADQPAPLLTPLTAIFLHGGWFHMAGNMLFLWIFGDNVEDNVGHGRYAAFYLLCGVIASFAQMAIDVDELTPSIGASGAVAGVMGAYLVLFPRATVIALLVFIPFPVPAVVLIGFWFVAQLLGGFSSLGVDAVGAEGGVAYFAHIGGFVAGVALITIFAAGRPRRRAPPSWRNPLDVW
jgi:membrane associated rhomboid family serine protease